VEGWACILLRSTLPVTTFLLLLLLLLLLLGLLLLPGGRPAGPIRRVQVPAGEAPQHNSRGTWGGRDRQPQHTAG
jgi:hypothetical protein